MFIDWNIYKIFLELCMLTRIMGVNHWWKLFHRVDGYLHISTKECSFLYLHNSEIFVMSSTIRDFKVKNNQEHSIPPPLVALLNICSPHLRALFRRGIILRNLFSGLTDFKTSLVSWPLKIFTDLCKSWENLFASDYNYVNRTSSFLANFLSETSYLS